MLSAINSALLSDDPYELLISQMIQIEREPQRALEERRDAQKLFKNVLSEVDSKISALHTLMTQFTAQVANPFAARSVTNGETDAYKISAGTKASLSTHTLDVQRLAKTDTRVSARYDSAAADLRTFFDANGAQTFTIDVAHPTESDPHERATISVTVDPTGSTNAEILEEIAAAINTAMSDAVEAGTITAAEKASAGLMHETSDTSRLSLSSGKTGYTHRLDFSDSAGGLLAALELSRAAVVDNDTASGGMLADVGTGELDSELNAVFVLDGLTHYRSSNTVTDALTDVTINLTRVSDGAADFSVVSDKESVKADIQDFIEKYNGLLEHLQQKSKVDAEAKTRGPLAGDFVFSDLRFSLRNEIARAVDGQPAGAPSFLSDLGVTINKDGTLELTDEDKLIAAVEADAGAVQSLFSGDDGIATRIAERLDQFLGTKGIINNRNKVIDDRIRRLEDRISDWDDRMASREKVLREQFARLQEAIAVFQGQQDLVNGFFYSGF